MIKLHVEDHSIFWNEDVVWAVYEEATVGEMSKALELLMYQAKDMGMPLVANLIGEALSAVPPEIRHDSEFTLHGAQFQLPF